MHNTSGNETLRIDGQTGDIDRAGVVTPGQFYQRSSSYGGYEGTVSATMQTTS